MRSDVPVYDRVWRVSTRLPDRHGQACRLLACGALNTALVEFPDGFRVYTSRYYVRRASLLVGTGSSAARRRGRRGRG